MKDSALPSLSTHTTWCNCRNAARFSGLFVAVTLAFPGFELQWP
jgi:hypothetical protein